MSNFKKGDKVQLIPFEEALRLQAEDSMYETTPGDETAVLGISVTTWNELIHTQGTIKRVHSYDGDCKVYKVGFERTSEVDNWFIPEFALKVVPTEIRVHVKQMGPGYINLELTVYDPETQQERPATFKETKSYVEQHPDILGFGGWIMGANGVHQCID